MEELISVIVPVYNVEKYVEKCVESIINQTYKNIEIILVDDGSTDNSGKIIDNISLKDNRIKVIHKENGGLSDARKAGLDICNGKYIGFVDSDDSIHKKMYEILYKNIKKYSANISICRIEKTETDKVFCTRKYEYASDPILLSSKIAIEELFMDKIDVSSCNKLFKADLFANIRFPYGKTNEDFAVLYKLFLNSTNIIYTSKAMYYYIERSNSITTEGFNIKQFDKYYNCLDMQKYIKMLYPQFLKSANRYLWYQTFCLLKKLYIDELNNSYKKYSNEMRKTIKDDFREIINDNVLTFKEKIMYLIIGFFPKIYVLINKF